jgi:hypothetical protein
VNVRQQLSEIAHVDQRAADRAVAEMIVSVWATPLDRTLSCLKLWLEAEFLAFASDVVHAIGAAQEICRLLGPPSE